MKEILHIKDEVLAPAELRVHPEIIALDDIPAEKLVPEHAVIVVRGTFRHPVRKLLPREKSLRVDRALPGDPLLDDSVEIRYDNIRFLFFQCADKLPAGFRSDPVIRIEKLDIAALCDGERRISGIGDAGIFLMDDTDPRILFAEAVTELFGAVLAAIVHEEELEVFEIL